MVCRTTIFAHFLCLVRLTGLEPARRETPDPKSGASTNSATGAKRIISHSAKSFRANSINESFP